VVALTLPEEVLEALRTLHHDLGWAIVQLVQPILHSGEKRPQARVPKPLAELVHLPGGRALIVVEPRVFRNLRGVSTIPLADGRAFLAFDQNGGLAELELAILDRLETLPTGLQERTQLVQVRDIMRKWRRGPGLAFRSKAIIVVEGGSRGKRRPLSNLDHV
jgi:hypothetical protein